MKTALLQPFHEKNGIHLLTTSMQFTLLNIVLFLLTRAFTAFSLTKSPKNSSDQCSISQQVWRMHLYLVQI